jgi:hypothetical protein
MHACGELKNVFFRSMHVSRAVSLARVIDFRRQGIARRAQSTRAELFVAEEAAAAGRYNCCSHSTTVVDLARFLTQKYPQYDVKRNLQ